MNQYVRFIGNDYLGNKRYQHLCYESPFTVGEKHCISTKIHYSYSGWSPSSWIIGAAVFAYRDFVGMGMVFVHSEEEGFELSHAIFANLFEVYLNQTRYYKEDKNWQIYVKSEYGVITTTRPNLDQSSAPRIDINHLFWVARCASEVLEFIESDE